MTALIIGRCFSDDMMQQSTRSVFNTPWLVFHLIMQNCALDGDTQPLPFVHQIRSSIWHKWWPCSPLPCKLFFQEMWVTSLHVTVPHPLSLNHDQTCETHFLRQKENVPLIRSCHTSQTNTVGAVWFMQKRVCFVLGFLVPEKGEPSRSASSEMTTVWMDEIWVAFLIDIQSPGEWDSGGTHCLIRHYN